MRRTMWLVVTAVGLATFVPRHAPGEARPIAWNQALGADPARLDAAQRQRGAALLQSEMCYFGCSRSIARCLEAERPSRTARRLAGYVVRQLLAGRTDEQIREGIRERGLSAHPVETATIDLAGAQCAGPADAAVTIVEYADFECPLCRVVSPLLHGLVAGSSPDVRVCFKQFPVRGHDHALPAAIAALAAARQGRFWQMHDALYASAPRLDEEHLVAAARRAGVTDVARWNADRADPAIRQQVEADKLEGIRNGVRGTPAIFVNGKEYHGQRTAAELRDRVEEELDILRGQS